MAYCPFCTQGLPPEATACPHCARQLPQDVYDVAEEAYEVPVEAEIPLEWQSVALYTLETPARCPYCREPIRSVRVLRMSRTQVPFTSTLPRSGRAIVCPQCERILSVELASLLS